MILAIESTCDESGIAVITGDRTNFAVPVNLLASQVDVHEKYGGVMPRIAAREHVKNFPVLLEQLRDGLKEHGISLKDVTQIAYSHEPGLEPSLLVGRHLAIGLAYFLNVPLTPVNHVYAHLVAPLLENDNVSAYEFPLIGLVVSGGHTRLYYMRGFTDFEIIGDTRDDAAGEAFDKVAAMLAIPYPGGPHIERLAADGDVNRFSFPLGLIDSGNYEFSFSGLKTSVRYALRDLGFERNDSTIASEINTQLKKDIAAAVQSAIIQVLAIKTFSAAIEYNAKGIVISGGVSANQALVNRFTSIARLMPEPIAIHASPGSFATDNAAMIGLAALINQARLDITI